MKAQPSVALVVPVYNGKEHTRELLESLRRVSYTNYKTVVIDDGSSDGTEEMIREEFPEVILLKGDGNLWSSGAINMGIEKAIETGSEYALIIDNDIVVHPEFISALVDTAEENPRSIIVPKVYQYYDPKRIESAGYYTRRLGLDTPPIGEGEIDQGQYNSQRDIPCAMTMMLVNTAFFEDLGKMDAENLPLYGADKDFTLRARKKGYRIIYEPRSMLWHKRHTTAKNELPETTSLLERLKYLTSSYKSSVCLHTYKVMTFRHYPKYLILPRLMIYLRLLILKILRNDLT